MIQCDFIGVTKDPSPFPYSTYPGLDEMLLSETYTIFCLDDVGEDTDDNPATTNGFYVNGDDKDPEAKVFECDQSPADLKIALELKAKSYSSVPVLIILGDTNTPHTGTSTDPSVPDAFTLTSAHSDLIIYGINQSKSIIQNSDTNRTIAYTFKLTDGVTDVTFENLTLDGNGSSLPKAADETNYYAGNVYIEDAGTVTFERVFFTNSYFQALLIDKADSVLFNNSTIENTTAGDAPYDIKLGIENLGGDLIVSGEETSISGVDYAVINVGTSTTFTDTGTTYADEGVIPIFNYQNDVTLTGTSFVSSTTSTTAMDMFSEDTGNVTLTDVTGVTKMVGCQYDMDTTTGTADIDSSLSTFSLINSSVATFYFGTVTAATSTSKITSLYVVDPVNTTTGTVLSEDLSTLTPADYTTHEISCDPTLY